MSNCTHKNADWKRAKNPVLTAEGLRSYSCLKCTKCGEILEEQFTPIDKKHGKSMTKGLRRTNPTMEQ